MVDTATYISSRCKSGRIGKKWTVGARVGIAAHAGTRMTIGALRLLHGRTQYMSGSAASRQETCAARHAGPRNSCNPLRQRCGARRRHRASEGCESRWRRRRSRASQVCCPSSVRCHPGSAEAAGASASLRVWFFLIVHLAEMEVAVGKPRKGEIGESDEGGERWSEGRDTDRPSVVHM